MKNLTRLEIRNNNELLWNKDDYTKNIENFYQWFVGFSDAESSFFIQPVLNSKGVVNRFSFKFGIELHTDDRAVLEFILSKLEIGNFRISNDKCIYVVSDKIGIYKLINIFDEFNLNSTKFLDYSNFKEAFILYHERESFTEELKERILEIKNSMNIKRTDFNMNNHNVVITKYWLLGFIEGDGSFFISRTKLTPILSIEQSDCNLPLLLKIKEFLILNLGFDLYSVHKLRSSSIISINQQRVRLGKPSVIFVIQNIYLLHNYIIPFLEDMQFISKKGLDFVDFRTICKAVYCGSHKRANLKDLILKLSYTMNNFRLSTYSGEYTTVPLLQSEIDTIIYAEPTIERLSDGRVRDLATNKIVPSVASCVYEITTPDGVVLIVESLDEVLNTVGVGFRTLKKGLDLAGPEGQEFNRHIVKRVPIFLPLGK